MKKCLGPEAEVGLDRGAVETGARAGDGPGTTTMVAFGPVLRLVQLLVIYLGLVETMMTGEDS